MRIRGGVSCAGGADPQQNFLGFMLYNRAWFNQDKLALTVGGGAVSNQGSLYPALYRLEDRGWIDAAGRIGGRSNTGSIQGR